MTAYIAVLVAVLVAIWFLGIWLGHQEEMRHRPRYQGHREFPCSADLVVWDRQHNNVASERQPNRHLC
jgi:hypothetical protein